jgi:pimeloyl-ACP methyl ester carboxylesterase
MALIPELGPLRELSLTGGPLRLHDRGDGDPILFLHGFFANSGVWRDVVPLLADDYRCIAPDLPMGFQAAAANADADLSLPGIADTLAEALAELEIDRVTVVGNDLGGALAQVFTARYPRRVKRLVLTACDSFWNCPAHLLKPFRALCFVPGFLTASTLPFRFALMRRAAHRLSANSHVPDPILLATYAPALQNTAVRRDMGRFIRALTPRDTEAAARDLTDFRGPAAVVWARTIWFPMSHARRLAQILDGWLHVVDDSGAFIPEDQPEELVEIIRRLMAVKASATDLARQQVG